MAGLSSGLIPILFGAVTIILGAIGWTIASPNYSFHSILVILLKTLSNLAPKSGGLENGNWITDLSAVTGLLTFYSSLAFVVITVLGESSRKLAARLFHRDHVVVFGETPLAGRLASIWQKRDPRTLQVIPKDSATPLDLKSRRVRHELDESVIDAFALRHARHVVLDLGDDTRTIAFAFRLLSVLSKSRAALGVSQSGEWSVVVRNRDLAEHFSAKFSELKALHKNSRFPDIFYLDPDRLIARYFVASHPLFLIAEQAGQTYVHALIAGDFGSMGSRLLEQVLLTSSVSGQTALRVTVLAPEAESQRRRFFSGRPSLAKQVDVRFLELNTIEDFLSSEKETATAPAGSLRAADEEMPVSVIFLCSGSLEENIRLAILLRTIRRKTGRLHAPIFCREDRLNVSDTLLSSETFDQAIEGFAMFGFDDAFLEAQICDPTKRDRLARFLHESYMAASKSTVGWEDLPVSDRRANCNAADHCLAKLYSLGFDVNAIPVGSVPKLREEDARILLDEASDAESKAAAAPISDVVRLEHDRWVLERRLDGWTHAAETDRVRQTHRLLVSYETLAAQFPDGVVTCRQQVEALLRCLVADGDPDVVLKRRAASGARQQDGHG